jgi:acyl-CoA synthetase (NDP forming)
MEKFFYPKSIVIIGLSNKANNIARLILDNLLRWGFNGRLFGLNPKTEDSHVSGIGIYRTMGDLPEVPDLAVCFVPARFVPEYLETCGKFGIRRVAIPSGGFSELNEEGERLSASLISIARKYDVRFMGPNGLMVANTANGLCLPFIPLFPPPKGGMSFISQSGGLGLLLWHLMVNENIGMAKFASIGNKLDIDEVDVLEYLNEDPETDTICIYLESVTRGKRLIDAAANTTKPVVVYKANTTAAGKRAALSHTSAMSNDEDIIDAAFEESGIIRIHDYSDFVAVAKAFKLPPMRGNRIMVMSPFGGFGVIGADLCEKAGFEFADPGEEFYDGLKKFTNAGVIRFSNPLDMGDIYDPHMAAHVGYEVLHNDNVDGAIYIGQRASMPGGDSVFKEYASVDVSKDIYGAMLSSGKPLAICLYGLTGSLQAAKQSTRFPIFNSPEEMVRALVLQKKWHEKKAMGSRKEPVRPNYKKEDVRAWLDSQDAAVGEDSLELLEMVGVPVMTSGIAMDDKGAREIAGNIGYPVVMKVVSPDALHKSEAGGVVVGVRDGDEVKRYFAHIRENLEKYKKGARFEGIRIQKMATEGYDMFIGGKFDRAFGPVVVFGFGGIYVEVFKDVQTCLCPVDPGLVRKKIESLKSYAILKGARGMKPADVDGYVDSIVRVSWLLAEFPEIKELDINPLRLFQEAPGVCALDSRIVIEKG